MAGHQVGAHQPALAGGVIAELGIIESRFTRPRIVFVAGKFEFVRRPGGWFDLESTLESRGES
jgi:hypothetical protein